MTKQLTGYELKKAFMSNQRFFSKSEIKELVYNHVSVPVIELCKDAGVDYVSTIRSLNGIHKRLDLEDANKLSKAIKKHIIRP